MNAELILVKEVLDLARLSMASDEQYAAFRKRILDRFNNDHKKRLLEILQEYVLRFDRDFHDPKQLSLSAALDLLDGIAPEYAEIKEAIREGIEPIMPADTSSDDFETMKSVAAVAVVREMLGS
jgi:uncharacterized Zn finger protein